MKGKKEFTRSDADAIRYLLIKKCKATREEQKVIRNKIRDFGFYINDFKRKRSGFMPEDLDNIINEKIIRIL